MKTLATSLMMAFLILGAPSGPAFAQYPARAEAPSGRLATEISQEIFSPFCPGKTLAMCPSPSAAEVRREIHELATEGHDKDTIKLKVLERYGEEFRVVEPPTEDNLMLGVMVAVGLLACLGLLFFITRRGDDDVVPTADAQDDEEAGDPYLAELRGEYRS